MSYELDRGSFGLGEREVVGIMESYQKGRSTVKKLYTVKKVLNKVL